MRLTSSAFRDANDINATADAPTMLGGALEIVAASMVAGFAQHVALHPLDTLKVRLQYARDTPKFGLGAQLRTVAGRPPPRPMPTSIAGYDAGRAARRHWNVPLVQDVVGAARMLRSTRASSLYAGLAPSLVAVVPTALVYMPTYEAASAGLRGASCPGPLVAPLSGVLTGVVCASVRVPCSVVKTRVQAGLSPSATAAVRQIVRGGGLAALYMGFGATVALDVAVAVVQFSVLDAGRRYSSLSHAALGSLAACLATAATEPIDVVRTRIMAQLRASEGKEAKGADFNYRSLADGLAKAARTEGPGALYRGLLPRLVLKSLGGAIWHGSRRPTFFSPGVTEISTGTRPT